MRVLLNGITALKPRTGIGQYTVRLAAEMAKLLPGEFAVYPPEPLAKIAKRFLPKGSSPGGSTVRWKSMTKSALKHWGRAATSWHFAKYCHQYGAKLYHEPNYLPLACGVPTVITVHDLSVILHPEWHPADRVREHVKKLERAVANAAHIITDTHQVKRELITELGVSLDQITAIHLGVGEEFRPVQPLFDEPYFLCVGTIEPRKNLLTAMKAFAALPRSVRSKCPLLLAGPWGWRAEAEFEYYDRVGREAGIRHLGYVADDVMPALYSGAVATLYPSLYEGFGLPPLEAVACGSSAICSAGTLAVREVMGNAATYCEAQDIDAWRDAMSDGYLSYSPPFRERAGEVSSKKFTWSRTALDTLNVYDQVLNGRQSLRAAA